MVPNRFTIDWFYSILVRNAVTCFLAAVFELQIERLFISHTKIEEDLRGSKSILGRMTLQMKY